MLEQRIRRWKILWSALPQAEHVALGILEVSECAHARDRSSSDYGAAALVFNLLQCVVNAVDTDRDHRRSRDSGISLHHAAVDGAWFGGHLALFVHCGGLHRRVLTFTHRYCLELPVKDGAIETLCSLDVLGRNLEVHDLLHDQLPPG